MRESVLPFLSVLVDAQIRILSPESLVMDLKFDGPPHPGLPSGTILGSTSTFGVPFFDQHVKGRILYARPTREQHCTAQDYDIPDLPKGQEVVRIVMVDRGECSFVEKVRIAQDYKGAQAVIIVDNKGLSPAKIKHVIVGDDGHLGGQLLRIPSVLISRKEGEMIKKAVLGGKKVLAELAWDVPTGNVATFDFWHSSGSREASNFLVEVAPYVHRLRWNMQYRPHFHIFSFGKDAKDFNGLCLPEGEKLPRPRPTQDDEDRPDDDRRLQSRSGGGRYPGGRYCATDPDGDGPITGMDVVMENVHQYCIWETGRMIPPASFLDHDGLTFEKQRATYSPNYWNYITLFHSNCKINGTTPKTRFGPTCSRLVRGKIPNATGTNFKAVEDCMVGKAEILEQEMRDHAWSPLAARINGWRYAGQLDVVGVIKALCSGLRTRPNECEDLQYTKYTFDSVRSVRKTSGISFVTAMIIFVFLVGAIVFFLYVYVQYLKKGMRSSVREEVFLEVTHSRFQKDKYMALDGD
jgi:hypothetical protein